MKTMKKKMTTTHTTLRLATLGAAASALFACGGGADVDHFTARQALQANTRLHATTLENSAGFLEDSELFLYGVDRTSSPEICVGAAPGGGDVEPRCEPVEDDGSRVELEVTEPAEELLRVLDAYVFHEGNLELEEGDRVVYLMRGAVVCQDAGADKNTCIKQVDQAQIRIDITSPQTGDLDIRLLVGPNRLEPVMLQLYQDMVALEVDLAATKGAVQHVASVAGEQVDLPSVMQGRLRGELRRHNAQKFGASVSVLEALKVAEGDFSLAAAAANPVAGLTIDGQAKTVTTDHNLGVVDLSFPITTTEYTWDEQTGRESSTTSKLQYGLHLGGLTGQMVLDAVSETIKLTGVGLGQETTKFFVDGSEVVNIDLNADSGRTFDATLKHDAASDSLDVSVAPGFDLEAVFDFLSVKDKLDDVDDYLLDEVLRITLGGTSPRLLIHDSKVEVVSGTLTLSSQSASITHTANAGMCMFDTGDTAIDSSSDPIGDGSIPEPTKQHPFEELMVDMCQ